MIMIGFSGFCSPTPRALSACMGTSFPPTHHNRTEHNTSPSTNISLEHCTQLCWDRPTVHWTVLTRHSSPNRAQTGAQYWNARHQLSWFLDTHCLLAQPVGPTRTQCPDTLPSSPPIRTLARDQVGLAGCHDPSFISRSIIIISIIFPLHTIADWTAACLSLIDGISIFQYLQPVFLHQTQQTL